MKLPLPITSFACLAGLSFLTATASAETLLTYTINGSTLAPSTEGANITGDASVWGSGLPAGADRGFGAGGLSLYARASIVNEAVSATSTDYVEFGLSADTGFVANLSTISFSYGFTHGNTVMPVQTATFALRSSVDNYASNIAVFTRDSQQANSDFISTGSISLSAAGFQGLDAISFRLFLADDGVNSTSYTLRLDNISLDGSTSAAAVPEPSAYASLLGLGAIGFVVLRRRRS